MWARFRSRTKKIKTVDEQNQDRETRRRPNVNEEYLCAFRTKSYGDFFIKAQQLINGPSSLSSSPEILLEPGQESIPTILDSSNLSRNCNLKSLLSNYFEISADASNFCSCLLKNINTVQSDYRSIQRVIDTFTGFDFSDDERLNCCRLISELSSINNVLDNPFSDQDRHDFTRIRDEYSSMLQKLKSRKKRFLKSRKKQLDVAARGTYIVNRDFDTISRLVWRLHDEIEHDREMIRLCLDKRENRICVQVLKEMKKNSVGFGKQVEELEEHVYLCLVTINRARALVVKEIAKSNSRQ